MNILWLKDGKLGHEKQVQALLDEICKIEESNIHERKIENISFLSSLNPFKSEIRKDCNILASHSIDMIVGAGHNTYSQILSYKKNLSPIPKAIAILAPSFRKKDFDFIGNGKLVSKKKPYPDIYKVALKKFNLSSDECLAIEDTEESMKSALRAKILCVAFPGKLHEKKKFKGSYKITKKLIIKDVFSNLKNF